MELYRYSTSDWRMSEKDESIMPPGWFLEFFELHRAENDSHIGPLRRAVKLYRLVESRAQQNSGIPVTILASEAAPIFCGYLEDKTPTSPRRVWRIGPLDTPSTMPHEQLLAINLYETVLEMYNKNQDTPLVIDFYQWRSALEAEGIDVRSNKYDSPK